MSLTTLQKSELGPHANEKQMPSWLVKLLETDGETTTVNRLDGGGKLRKVRVCLNREAGIIPVLQQLLHQDKTTAYAYLCDPTIKHISKLKREGLPITSQVLSVSNVYRGLLWVSQHTDDEFVHRRS